MGPGNSLRPRATSTTTAATTTSTPVKPTIELRADAKETTEGSTITYTISTDIAPATDLSVDLTIGGDAKRR